MKLMSEETTSVWMATATVPHQSTLKEDLSVDVCVVGAGIAGLSTAYRLSQEGLKVAVLDSRHEAAGQTQRTSAHLTNAHDDLYSEVEKIHGLEGIRMAAESHTAAIDEIERTIKRHKIDCEFQRLPGYLFCGPRQSQNLLDKEFAAAQRAGIQGLEFVSRAPFSSFDTGRCIRYPQQGQFHPLKYMNGLAAAIRRAGGQIFDNAPVKEVEGGQMARIETAHGPTVMANAVVVATNAPINDIYAIHTKQAPYLTYVIGIRIPQGFIPTALYWDTEDPYHYIRLQHFDEASDILIVGGEDHKAGQVTDQVERHWRLEAWARQRFDLLGDVEFRWSGMTMETTDGCAFIGRNPDDEPNVFIATGDSGMGLTHGTIAGMLLTDLIQGRSNRWEKLYNPSRRPIAGRAWRQFLSENVNVAKEMAQDWLSGGDYPAVNQLPNDSGTVIRDGFSKMAVYRDDEGALHQCSAVCPHLGCIVHWNKLDKVWDCPCHGSRFDAYGHVINGPAVSGLKPIHSEAPQETVTASDDGSL